MPRHQHISVAISTGCRNELSARFSVDLPATVIFDYPTPASLAAFAAAELSRRSAPLVPTHAAHTHAAAATGPSLEHLQQQLLELVAEASGAAVESVQQPLMEAGVDSIGSVELRWVPSWLALLCPVRAS